MLKSKKKKLDEVREVAIDEIQPSPENDKLYGAINTKDPELVDLANDIIGKGQLEPIRVSMDGYIVSGHRRYAACKLARRKTVRVIYQNVFRSDFDEIGWQRELRQWNRQRHKSNVVRLREAILDIDPNVAYQELQEIRDRGESDVENHSIEIDGETVRSRISDAKSPMLEAARAVIDSMRKYWPLTVRQIHYGLLNDPPLRHAKKPESRYENNRKCYADLCDLLARARLCGRVSFASITDETRPVKNTYFPVDVSTFLSNECYSFLAGYRRDLLQSQHCHFELVVEKQTALNIVQPVAKRFCMPLTIGRGYCSLEPRNQIHNRYCQSGKDKLVLLVCSDLDPDGDAIAHSLTRSMRDDFGADVEAYKALLTFDQVQEWEIEPNEMEAKSSSSNYDKYVAEHGTTDVYELEAIPPAKMQSALEEFILTVIDVDLYNEEVEQEKLEAAKIAAIRQHVVETTNELMEQFPD